MYPFKDDNVYVRNAWYVAGYSEEFTQTPFERTIMDNPIVFFRTESGKVAAMHAMCPHRYYPLALHGKVIGETIRCNYHGYTFDGPSGACVRIPSAPGAPQNFSQRVYPVVESGPWVWIWPGAPELADEAKIPTLDALRMGENWAISPMMEVKHVKGRYMLGAENLMDLTHVAYLHGIHMDFDEIVTAPLEITETDDQFLVRRPMNIGWSPLLDMIYGPELKYDAVAEADSESIVQTPGYYMNTSHTPRRVDGLGDLDVTVYGELWFHHVLTPETKHSTHYFGTQSRSHRLNDDALGELLKRVDTQIRGEDVEAIEAIEQRIMQFGEPPVELMTKSDAAGGRLRRKIQRAILAEVAQAGGSAGSTSMT